MGPRLIDGFPVEFFLRFLHVHGMLRPVMPPRWRTVRGGSRAYVDALCRLSRFRLLLSTPIDAVLRDEKGVSLGLNSGKEERYDRVVIACHSDQALALLDAPSRDEAELLGSIRYTENDIWLHTSSAFLPQHPRARASWNYLVDDGDEVTVTYWLNSLMGLPEGMNACVTLNPKRQVPPETVVANYQTGHPLFDLGALRAQPHLPKLNGRKHTAFAGAYFGFGFHEDGMRAGLAAARSLA